MLKKHIQTGAERADKFNNNKMCIGKALKGMSES